MDFQFKFILLAIFGVQVGNCQDCSWTAILSSSEYDVFAVNAHAEFSVSVTGVISDTERFSWYYNDTIVSQFRYNISEDSLYQNFEFSRGTAKISKTGPNQVEFQLNFTTLTTFDNNTALQTRKHGCSPTTQYSTPKYYIQTENCTKDSPGPANAVLTDPSATCQHLCRTGVNCSVGYIPSSSMATCQFDTSWKDDCEPVTCSLTLCTNCNNTGNVDLTNIGYNQTVEIRCNDATGTSVNFTCTTPENFVPELKCTATDFTTVSVNDLSTTFATTDSCQCSISICEFCCFDEDYSQEQKELSCGQSLTVKCCNESYLGEPIHFTCEETSNLETFKPELNCRATASDARMPPGDIAGTVLTVALVIVCVIAGVAIFLAYAWSMIVKIFYGVCIILSVPGILMSFLGTDPGTGELVPGSALNGVEIAGIVIATIGTVLGIVGVALHFQGEKDKG